MAVEPLQENQWSATCSARRRTAILEAVPYSLKTKALRVAAEKLGGVAELRRHLGVSSADLADWLAGTKAPPEEVFLRAVEVVLAALDASDSRRR